jgi:hypothetical protein
MGNGVKDFFLKGDYKPFLFSKNFKILKKLNERNQKSIFCYILKFLFPLKFYSILVRYRQPIHYSSISPLNITSQKKYRIDIENSTPKPFRLRANVHKVTSFINFFPLSIDRLIFIYQFLCT